jgi:putative hemolysin
MSQGWSLVAVPFLIALNAFFVAAEYAVVALRPTQLENLRRRGWIGAAHAMERLKADPASTIGTIQICITMTNLLLGWIGEPAISRLLHGLFRPIATVIPATAFEVTTLAISFLVVTLLTVVLSELLPKALTLRHAETVTMFTAVPVLAVQKGVRPLVWLMNVMANAVTRTLGLGSVTAADEQQVTVDEVLAMTTAATDTGAMKPHERSMIFAALSLGRRQVTEIRIHRTQVAYLDLQWSMERNRQIIDGHLYSRLPVCDGGMDHVIGVLHTKEFLAAYHAAAESVVLSLLVHKPVFVPNTLPVDRLLASFRDGRTEMLIVVDEHGGVDGIVTLKDVVDEIVGPVEERAA